MKFISLTPKRIILGISFVVLLIANICIHAQAMSMSEQALFYEKNVNQYRQSNIVLEESLLKHSSIDTLSQIAKIHGYEAPTQPSRWINADAVAMK